MPLADPTLWFVSERRLMGLRRFTASRSPGSHAGWRLYRFAIVTVGNLVLSIGLLALFVGIFRWSATVSTLLGAGIALGPLYLVSRYWVWEVDRQRARFLRDGAVFVLLNLPGVGISTVAASAAELVARHLGLSHGLSTILILVTVLTSYGVLWILRFFILDRWIWPQARARRKPAGSTVNTYDS